MMELSPRCLTGKGTPFVWADKDKLDDDSLADPEVEAIGEKYSSFTPKIC
jgi:hypothetical protein